MNDIIKRLEDEANFCMKNPHYCSIRTFDILEGARGKIKELEAENHKLKLTMQLHAGDCCSLNNEVELFRGHWEDAEERCDELQAKVVLAMSQNYCKICGNTLDGYVPPDVPDIEDRCNKLEKALKLTIDRWRLIGRKIWDTKVKVSIFELGRQLEKEVEEILKG